MFTVSTNHPLIKVKSIAECSNGSILQYFCPSLSYYLSLRSLFCLFLSGRFTQVLLSRPISLNSGHFDLSIFEWPFYTGITVKTIYHLMQVKRTLAFIKLPFVIKIFVLSIFEWLFYTGLTVLYLQSA